MSENILRLKDCTKSDQYEYLIPQLQGLLAGEDDVIANMANVSAALKEVFGFFWVGFYLLKHDQLVLGPFQGPVACTRISYGRGVCGAAWKSGQTVVVKDVNEFPGHIACSSLSQSEIVVPLLREGNVWAVLDIDSEHLNSFDEIDRQYLEKIVELIAV